MNIKDKLIEELKKEMWFFDTYLCSDRVNAIFSLYPDIETNSYRKLDEGCRYLSCYYTDVEFFRIANYEKSKDLTQLINKYLEEHEPKIWMRSVLAAIQLGLKVERHYAIGNVWFREDFSTSLELRYKQKYRINYEAPKLVSDEIWEMIDNNIIDGVKEIDYITKDKCGSIRGHKIKPDLHEASGLWRKLGGSSFGLEHKLFENQAIMDVDWKDSLCTRTNKREKNEH